MKIYLESLGCVRNLVDSEIMIEKLSKDGWILTEEPDKAEIIIVNTCSFIKAAINESIATILQLAEYKKKGNCKTLIVTGCMPERFKDEIASSMPEVDLFLGTGNFEQIAEFVQYNIVKANCILSDPNKRELQTYKNPGIPTFKNIAYLKIAEGCSKHCTFCIIPKLRGKHRSRPVEDITTHAEYLISLGIKELILVAQDTTFYGKDLNNDESAIERLIDNISKISNNTWIRFLYGHPQSITDGFIKKIAETNNVCKYFDIPIQHVSKNVLKKMGRNYDEEQLNELFYKIRSTVPEAVIRTTVITGFPGETEKDFEDLLGFIKKIKFDHLGAFVYSDFDDLPSHNLPDHVPNKIAKKRRNKIMSTQAKISRQNNEKYKNKILKVLIENNPENGLYEGRTVFQAPEVDGITYIKSKNLNIGDFADIKIIDTLEYDLIGEAIWHH
ncbi:MAG: 30S ribosomal protein S12 methylthiotransferase RimO [Desulfobacterales bacterium]|nr:30S ribosomal protein S12 methylthiotransferase RimO [Desulfobacterales bacterium]